MSKKKDTASGCGKFALIVGDEGAILIHMQRKKILRRVFAASLEADSVRQMEEILAAMPRAPITLLVDMIDQSYIRQTIPPVSALNVGKIIKRRLAKDFSPDDIKGYILLPREKSGRKDWNYLMASIASTSLLQSWLDFIVERTNPFAGIGLFPLEMQPCINALEKASNDSGRASKTLGPTEWQILVSHHKVGGFRQTVLRGGKLIFTRITQPVGEASAAVIAGNIEQEMVNTIEYLRRMGLQDMASLSVTVIISADIKQTLDLKKIKAGACQVFTPFETAELLALESAAKPEDHFADIVISAFIMQQRRLILPLHTPYTKKIKQVMRYTVLMRASLVLMMLGALAWTAMTGWDIVALKAEMEDAATEQTRLKRQMSELNTKIKVFPEKVDMYSNIMRLSQRFQNPAYEVLGFARRLEPLLAGQVIAKGMRWVINNPLDDDAGKRKIDVELDLQLSVPSDAQEKYLAATETLKKAILSVFPEFEIVHVDIPESVNDSKELKTTLTDAAETPDKTSSAPTGDMLLKIKLQGGGVLKLQPGGKTEYRPGDITVPGAPSPSVPAR